MRTSKVQKQWFAERCGELHVKDIKNHISIVIEEALERHNMQPTSQNRQDIYDAYKTANPRTSQYAKDTYDIFYERGTAKYTEENRTISDYLTIDRELSLKAVRDAIVNKFLTSNISSVDPKLLDIFKYGENNGLGRISYNSGSQISNGKSKIDELDDAVGRNFQKIESKES